MHHLDIGERLTLLVRKGLDLGVLVVVDHLQVIYLLFHLLDLVLRSIFLNIELLLQLDESVFGILALFVNGVDRFRFVKQA